MSLLDKFVLLLFLVFCSSVVFGFVIVALRKVAMVSFVVLLLCLLFFRISASQDSIIVDEKGDKGEVAMFCWFKHCTNLELKGLVQIELEADGHQFKVDVIYRINNYEKLYDWMPIKEKDMNEDESKEYIKQKIAKILLSLLRENLEQYEVDKRGEFMSLQRALQQDIDEQMRFYGVKVRSVRLFKKN